MQMNDGTDLIGGGVAAGRIVAPWTQAQVVGLNRWQMAGYVPEFTCGNRRTLFHVPGEDVLVATVAGWVCPSGCGYTQDWAHAFMADDPPAPHPLITVEEPDACPYCLDLGFNRPDDSGEFWTCPECGNLYGDCGTDDE
jgi:hypothetical protein